MEIWKDIPNYTGYQVSNKGNVRTYNKTTYTKKHGVRHWKNRLLKSKSGSYRTGKRVDLWKDGKPHSFLVGRLVAFTFYNVDIANHKLTVNHIDGNRMNNNLENLELVTLKENIIHGFSTGLYKTQKRIKIKDKTTGQAYVCRSYAKGSKLINKNIGYISNCINRGKYENNNFVWEPF